MAPTFGAADTARHDLPSSGWSARVTGLSPQDPTLLLLAGGHLVDVLVATVVDPALLRGARRGERDGRPWSLAWGQVPVEVDSVTVTFGYRVPRPASTVVLAGRFWLAETDRACSLVSVSAGPATMVVRVLAVLPAAVDHP